MMLYCALSRLQAKHSCEQCTRHHFNRIIGVGFTFAPLQLDGSGIFLEIYLSNRWAANFDLGWLIFTQITAKWVWWKIWKCSQILSHLPQKFPADCRRWWKPRCPSIQLPDRMTLSSTLCTLSSSKIVMLTCKSTSSHIPPSGTGSNINIRDRDLWTHENMEVWNWTHLSVLRRHRLQQCHHVMILPPERVVQKVLQDIKCRVNFLSQSGESRNQTLD